MTRFEWSEIIRFRDNYTCLFCGSTDDLEAHHIKHRKEAPELATEITNGVTLCHDCHLRAHGGSYGYHTRPLNPRFTVDYCRPVQVFVRDLEKVGGIPFEYDLIYVNLPKGKKKAIREHAERHGENINQFINRAIDETMARDTAETEGK